MSEVSGMTGEQISRMILHRELDEILDRRFTGEIRLECKRGEVVNYHVSEVRKPGTDHREIDRRRDGPRDGENRRRKD